MSIEWLLTKTASTDSQRKAPDNSHKENGLSDQTQVAKSTKQNRTTKESNEEQLRRIEFLSNTNMQNQQSRISLRCSCGYSGTVTQSKTDFKLIRTDLNGLAYFECSNCKRHLRYDPSTSTIKIKKGFLGVLFEKFS
jgi:hypothetical protein